MIFSIPSTRTVWTGYIMLLVFLALLAFGNLRTHHFWDGWDDWDLMADVAEMSTDLSHLFSQSRHYEVRPPVDLILLGGYFLWGENPAAFHLLHIGLHLFASLMVASTLRLLGFDLELSLVSGLLFLINVAHFRAVHWIICTNYTLALIFGLAVVCCYVQFLEKRSTRWLVWGVVALGLAVLSHPSSVSVAIFCTYLAWRRCRSVKQTANQSWHLLLAVAVFALLAHWISPPNSLESQGVFSRPELIRFPRNLFWYLGRLVTSAHWIAREISGNQQNLWEIWIGVLVLIGILILYRQRVFPVADLAVWSLVSILPFLNNRLDRLAFGPSRQLYLASVGSSLVLAWGLRAWIMRSKKWTSVQKRLVFSGALILLIASSILSLKRVEALSIYFAGRGYAFRSNNPEYGRIANQLFERALAKSSDIVPFDIYFRLVQNAFSLGQVPQATLEKAYLQDPDNPVYLFLLGIIDTRQDTLKARGERRIQQALDQAPDKNLYRFNGAVAYYNLARFYTHSGHDRIAANLLQKSLDLWPHHLPSLTILQNILEAQNRISEIILAYEKAVRFDPHNSRLHVILGQLYHSRDDLPKAIKAYQNALLHERENPLVHTNLATILYKSGDPASAQKHYQKALQLQPNNVIAYQNLGIILLEQGKLEEARRLLIGALVVVPNHPGLKNLLTHIQNRRDPPSPSGQ